MSDLVDISLTDRALNHIRASIERRGRGIGVRFGIKTTGCSGYAYKVEYVDQKRDDDTEVLVGDVAIFVQAKSIYYLNGSEIDFVREGLNEGFKFNNPNAKSYCGCGESFNV
ncbi:HesB/IscA family protein [Candidatus Ichthyocystis hellenicum]|uniref:HesB/IscA family protein n=1 Tax=Candidatus Ichthyocystis hellenicum TaxID=1561003 RepID=UPI000ACEFE82|nr:iron-sulfur cluster assembly accessory protein [Candidatus Ichthyocystis hellenicum]